MKILATNLPDDEQTLKTTLKTYSSKWGVPLE